MKKSVPFSSTTNMLIFEKGKILLMFTYHKFNSDLKIEEKR